MWKAGVVAAIGLTLLVPTFNALNNSYVENVQPPPWLKPEKPPNITPPTNFKPPTDWEGDFEGEFEGEMPTPPCPPPVLRVVEGSEQRFELGPGPGQSSYEVLFDLPNATLAFGGWVNFTGWRASSVSLSLEGPGSRTIWSDGDQAEAFLLQPQPADSRFTYDSREEDSQAPPATGTYVLRVSAEFPLDGDVTTKFVMALACGGLLS